MSMSEFGGLWKQQNNPACAKSVRVFIMLKLDIVRKKKQKPGPKPKRILSSDRGVKKK